MKLTVGLCGLAGLYAPGTPAEKIARRKMMAAATGINRDRIDLFDPASAAFIKQTIAEGTPVLPVYDHVAYGEVATTLPALIAAAGLTPQNCPRIEIRNEPYYEQITAQQYAVEYDAAKKALDGKGFILLAKGWGDYYDVNAWSQEEGGRGWNRDLQLALGYSVDEWAMHFYGPQGARGVQGGGNATGWGAITPTIANLVKDGIWKPVHITECGEDASVTPAEQASAWQQYVLEGCVLGIESVYIYSSNDGNGETYGCFDEHFNAKPAVAAVAGAMARLKAVAR